MHAAAAAKDEEDEEEETEEEEQSTPSPRTALPPCESEKQQATVRDRWSRFVVPWRAGLVRGQLTVVNNTTTDG